VYILTKLSANDAIFYILTVVLRDLNHACPDSISVELLFVLKLFATYSICNAQFFENNKDLGAPLFNPINPNPHCFKAITKVKKSLYSPILCTEATSLEYKHVVFRKP
jgi:hypothetical protein